MKNYKPTIGIETHVQLSTKTKLFSTVDNDAREKPPNSCVSPIDYALPGMLPLLNQAAITLAIRAGLALNAKINLTSRFDRKHYYYPDLPKGYQISQFYQPIIGPGHITLPDNTKIRIEHAHLEEDAGKLTHHGDYSLVDLNRAGTPLLEIVSMPDINSPEQARDYCKELWRLMTYAGVTHGDLYHGNMRFDVNISVAESTSKKLGTRAEIKNLNSFRSVERASAYEFTRQVALLEKGEKITQETRGWSDTTGRTTSQRSKEQAQDYRYMPEPDIPPIVLAPQHITDVKSDLPPLPPAYRAEFAPLNLDPSITESILDHPHLAAKLSAVLKSTGAAGARKVANWFSSVLLSAENTHLDKSLATPDQLSALATMLEKNQLSSTAAKEIFLKFYDEKTAEKSPHTLASEMNLIQENDTTALDHLIDEVLALPETQQAIADFKSGEQKALGFLIGQIMKHSHGKANPATSTQLLKQKLS